MIRFVQKNSLSKKHNIDYILNGLNNDNNFGVGLDVRYDNQRNIVLCDSVENITEKCITLKEFLESLSSHYFLEKKKIMFDIKVNDISEAKSIASDITMMVLQFSESLSNIVIMFCSLNEYCVLELCFLREHFDMIDWEIGVASSGLPFGFFKHLDDIDFVSIHYDSLSELIVENFHKSGREVIASNVNNDSVKTIIQKYNVDSFITNITV